MSDYSELKRLAEAATPTPWERGDGNEVMVSEEGDEAYWSWEQAGPAQIHGSGEQPVRDADFIAAANPAAVLALIAENDRLKTLRSTTERDLAQELEVWRHGPSCWTCGDTGDVHDMVGEWRGQCDCNAAKVIDVASERDQLKAENERLSTENSEIESAAITYIEDMQEAQRENARLTELFTVGMTLDGNLRVYGDWQSVRKAQEILAERDQLRAEIAGLRTGYEAYERVNAELKAENEALRKALKTAEDAMWHADGNMDGEAADARDALAVLGQGEQS